MLSTWKNVIKKKNSFWYISHEYITDRFKTRDQVATFLTRSLDKPACMVSTDSELVWQEEKGPQAYSWKGNKEDTEPPTSVP